MSDPLEELKRISAAEQAEAQEEAEAKARAAEKERDKEQRKASARALSGKRAPGFFSSMRFFVLAMVGFVYGTFVSIAWLEDDVWWRSTWSMGIVAAWLAVVGVLWLDAATWKRLLPFKVEGMETIDGTEQSGDETAPYIAFDVHIRFIGAGDNQARTKTLEILGERMNRVLKGDSEMGFSKEREWRVLEGGRLRGVGSRMLYRKRMLEEWMRREVRLLHRAFPVGAVTVHAKYTGDSFHVSSD